MMENNRQKLFKKRDDYMVNKKAVFTATVLVVLIVGLIIGIQIKKTSINEKYLEEKEQNLINASNSDVESNENKTTVTNSTENDTNTTEENEVNETTSSTEKNETTENSTNTAKNNNASTAEKNDSSEEAAMKLLEQKTSYKKDEVYFYVEEEVKKGVYIISIRDGETTTELESYKVDMNNKTITKN